MDLSCRRAIVTGAAQGLGAAIARALHERGASVVLADVRGRDAERAAAALGDRAEAAEMDVRDRDSIERVLDRASPVDVLVNNAAVTSTTRVWKIEHEEWDDVMAVNLRGVFFGCQLVGPQMRERGWGRIINLASIAGQQGGVVTGAHYAAAKAGVVVLTKIFAAELASRGVTVNAIAPAAVRTPALDLVPDERLEALRAQIPVGRFGEAHEVGALAAFLASDEAGYVTGATYDVNGGLLMR